MMWVCRVGKRGSLYNIVKETGELFLFWHELELNLKDLDSEEIKAIVAKEFSTDNRTTVQNYAGMIRSFVNAMKIGDFVIIPGNKEYHLVQITSDYYFKEAGTYHHFRKIRILKEHIPKTIFDQSTNYSLGAFRTVFRVKNEENILEAINME